MFSLPNLRALLMDVRAIRGSTAALYQPPRLPEAPPNVEAFWAARHVGAGPLPDLAASLRLLETTEAGDISAFTFPSRETLPDAENNLVSGRSYIPARPTPGSAAPFLLLLHANGADGAYEAWHARRLMQRGCRVAHIALPYQMGRRPQHVKASTSILSADVSHTLLLLGQAVCDAADVLRWVRAQGAGRVLLAGWSLGGLVAALVATQIPLDGVLLVEPAANLAWEMTHRGLFPWQVRRHLRRAGLSQAALEAFLAPVVPANLRPQVPVAGLRMLAARYDLLVGYQPVLALWRAWGQPALHVQPTSHVQLLFHPAVTQELDELVGC